MTVRFLISLLACVTLVTGLITTATATPVVVHLRNGDQITGDLLAQETNHIVIQTGWAGVLSLPVGIVGGLRTTGGENLLPAPKATTRPPENAPAKSKAATARPPQSPAAPKLWKHNLQFGSNLNAGARDQQLFYTRIKSTYQKPYEQNPKKFFRSTAEYSADYGETERVRSANRMSGSLKTDFDGGENSYFYNEGRAGYDEIRKIDLQYEVGPGLGYHLVRKPTFELDVESGLNYQSQKRSAGGDLKDVFFRAAEDSTWKLTSKLSFTKKFEFLVNAEDAEQFRLRLEANTNYKLFANMSLNLTLLEQYDTDPAPKVDQNELQIRSSIGLTF